MSSKTRRPKARKAGRAEPKAEPVRKRRPPAKTQKERDRRRKEDAAARKVKRHEIPEGVAHACKCPEPGCGCWLYRGDTGWACPMRHTKIIPPALFADLLGVAIRKVFLGVPLSGKELTRRLLYHQRRRPGWK